MIGKLNCVMLIDDNADDNFFHQRVINKTGRVNEIVVMESGEEALSYLKEHEKHPESNPDLIFLDINMPGMNGWEFLEEYETLSTEAKAKKVVVMLSTSFNPEDREKAMSIKSNERFLNKPLTVEDFCNLLERFFPEVSEE